MSNISLEVGESKREPFMIGIRVKTDTFMIEIFETCQTKAIAKQTNRDESLIIRSIIPLKNTSKAHKQQIESIIYQIRAKYTAQEIMSTKRANREK